MPFPSFPADALGRRSTLPRPIAARQIGFGTITRAGGAALRLVPPERAPARDGEPADRSAATLPCCGAASAVDTGSPDTRCYRLWEIEPASHCSLIGTCLTAEDLRRLMRKLDTGLPADAPDYEIHAYFVGQARSRSPLTKLVQKLLDRKYAVQIARFRRVATAAELQEMWHESLGGEDIAGAYWAFMTHRVPPPAMRQAARGEVHMLSHQIAKSVRDDGKRLQQLEAARAEAEGRLAASRNRAAAALRAKDDRIRALEAQLAASIPAVIIQPEATRQGELLSKLRERCDTLERRIEVERDRAAAAESKISALQGRAARGPVRSLQVPETNRPMPPGAGGSLHGQAILYVGGHPNIIPHLRDKVELLHGRFLSHDGGLEMHNGKLPGLVSQADLIFCPSVCISHDAFLRLKDLCRRQAKRFIVVRGASLSSFQAALAEFITADDQGCSRPVAPCRTNLVIKQSSV